MCGQYKFGTSHIPNHLSYPLTTHHPWFWFYVAYIIFWYNDTLLIFIQKEKSTGSRLRSYPILRAHVLGTVPTKTGDIFLVKLITV